MRPIDVLKELKRKVTQLKNDSHYSQEPGYALALTQVLLEITEMINQELSERETTQSTPAETDQSTPAQESIINTDPDTAFQKISDLSKPYAAHRSVDNHDSGRQMATNSIYDIDDQADAFLNSVFSLPESVRPNVIVASKKEEVKPSPETDNVQPVENEHVQTQPVEYSADTVQQSQVQNIVTTTFNPETGEVTESTAVNEIPKQQVKSPYGNVTVTIDTVNSSPASDEEKQQFQALVNGVQFSDDYTDMDDYENDEYGFSLSEDVF